MSNDPRGRGVRGANQRSDWDRDQQQALALLERAVQKSRYSQQRAFWCRRWVEWFLLWLGPEDFRTVTPDQLARFLKRYHASWWCDTPCRRFTTQSVGPRSK